MITKLISLILFIPFVCFAQTNINWQPSLGASIKWNSPLASGLVGIWLCNEGSGNKIFDLSNNGHDGDFVNMTPSTDWILGPHGNALDVIGNKRVDVNAGDIGNVFTLAVWVNPNSLTTLDAVIAEDGGQALYLHNGQINYFDGVNIFGNSTLVVDEWAFIAAVLNDGPCRLYLNGVDDGSGTSNSNSFTVNSFGDRNTGGEPYDGRIFSVYVYDRALTPKEIWSLYVDPYSMFDEPLIGRVLKTASAAAARRRTIN